MKHISRSFVALALCLSLIFSLSGCAFFVPAVSGETVEVTFVVGDKAETVSVPYGEAVSPPLTPKMENRIFSGWYTDASLQTEYDFSTPVSRPLSLYAGFVLDGAKITNQITLSVMSSLVTVENVYPVGGGREFVAQGSGFIYRIENGRAYVLTNCHVVYAPSGRQTLTVKDFQGESHIATVYRNSDHRSAISADYDLAILTFPYDGSSLTTIPFALQNSAEGDEVISLGSPENQSHAITFGESLGYRKANVEGSSPEESNVAFDIIYHTAAITNGSSGGPLLNGDLELIGVNYAGLPPAEGESFGRGCAVPLAKVMVFLSLYE